MATYIASAQASSSLHIRYSVIDRSHSIDIYVDSEHTPHFPGSHLSKYHPSNSEIRIALQFKDTPWANNPELRGYSYHTCMQRGYKI